MGVTSLNNKIRVINPNDPKHPANTIPTSQGGQQIAPKSGGLVAGGILEVTNDGHYSAYPPPVITYAWYSGVTATGITAREYTILAGDTGKIITCRMVATNSAGASSPAVSNGITLP